MCGIAGIYSLSDGLAPPTLDALSAMAGALAHRGPDEFGVYRGHRIGLSHARLSIIDLATGQQPMSNEDGTVWVTFNGEIFNYVELRRELIARGHAFRTQSDTEVLIRAYEAWGEDAFARFNGQWAVAIWDARRGRLVLSRDRFGVRPLYLCEHAGRLYFASEVKAIFAADAAIPRALDPAGLDQTFTFWTVVPPQSVFRGIRELPPGHTRTYRGSQFHETRYWQPRYPVIGADGEWQHEFRGTPARAAAAVRDRLVESTRLRMVRSDVPVGAYLSGGLDSSLIAALAARAARGTLSTFSIRFDDAEFDETEYQRAMAAALGSDHREVVVTRRDIAECFPEVIAHAERPILRTAPAPLFLLSRLVNRTGIKVVLTGEGADEMFAGYDVFREARIRRFWARQPHSRTRPRLLERLYQYLERSPVAQRDIARQFFGVNLDAWRQPGFGHDPRWRSTSALKRLFDPAFRSAAAGGDRGDAVGDLLRELPRDFDRWSPLAQDQYLEVHTLLSGYLLSSQGDRMLMAHSIEGRFPFLDPAVVELADSLPSAFKLRGLDEKHVLKHAARGLVPEHILERTKQPYRAPDAMSFIGPKSPDWICDVLQPNAVAAAGVFRPGAVEQLWTKVNGRDGGPFSNADNMALVGVLSTQLLHRQFVAERPAARGPMKPVAIADALGAASRDGHLTWPERPGAYAT